MAAAHAGTVNDWLETAALPVGDILNRRKYSFTVKLYQRPYEWSEPQVKKLARDLELAFQQNKEDYLLLGNVVLFCGSRDLGSTEQRPCDIIDGQQRLTTLLILYAVIQAMLNDAAAATADAADSAAAAAASTGIRQRMVSPDAVSAIIIDSHHRPRLLTNLFPFLDRAGHGGVGRMRERLAVESGKERNTAKTLIKHLSGYADKPQKLLEFLRFLNEHVYLTVTTTRRQHLAFKTFANLNYTGKPLSCLDVLKAIMVQDLPMERGDASAVLGAWNETVHAMATLQSYHEDYEGDAGAGEGRPRFETWIDPITVKFTVHGSSSSSAVAGQDGPTFFDELLQQIRIIHDALAGVDMRKADKEPLDYFTRTIAYFTEEFRINTQIDRPGIQADPLDFMARWVQAFKWPLVFLLSAGDWKPRGYALGVSFLNEGRFLLEARGIIFNLMTLPHTEWRAPVLFVLHMLRGRTKPGAALVAFLKQLECLGVYLELCKYPGIKINGKGLTNKRVYNHLIRELFKFNADCAAAPAQITDDQLGGIVRRLWSDEPGSGGDHVGVLRRPQSLVITDGLLTQDLYTVGRCARLAKSVLFMAEHEAKGSQAGGGVPHQWSGAITVEHVLPQGAEPDSNWFRPGSSGGSGWTAQASRQWLHKVGNLTLLSGPDNAAVGNRSFSDKKSILLERVHGRDAHEGMPVSTLVLTAQVAREESWTPAVVERRTAELAELLRARWRSLPPRPEPEPAPGPMRFRLVGTTPLSRQALGGPALGKILSQAGRQFLIGQGFAPQAQVLGYQGHVYRLVDLSRYAAVDARAVISRHQAVLRVSGDGVTVECAPWQPPDVQAGAPVMPMFLNGTQLEPGRQYEMDTDGTSLLCFGTGANSLKYTVTPYEGLAAVQEAAVAAAVAAAAPAVAESEEDEVVSDDEDDAAAVDLLDLALPLPHPDPVNDHRMAINLAMQLGAMGPIAQEMVETEAAVRAAGDNGDTPPRHPGAIDL